MDVILFLLPGQSNYVCPALTLAKLYSNSLLVLFNSRVHLDCGRTSLGTSHRSVSQRPFMSRSSKWNFLPFQTRDDDIYPMTNSPGTSVHIQVETWTDSGFVPINSLNSSRKV